ncbi:putative histone acetyltransferase type B subunit 2 [[Candida] railenensis]|uniref:Histone acetyltransferase type B subunit 2 n=1 Tax=[Candida] railenensis TaxID=45579 RepID=A0A9P0QS87_9ASCO|nr:putative histone acetyltransferase type B subunit 2 [[Candida] railenensis]
MTTDLELASAQREVLSELQTGEKLKNEEFKIWKKTVPLLYDTIQSHALERPVLSLSWLPTYDISENKNVISVKILIGLSSDESIEPVTSTAAPTATTSSKQKSQEYLKIVSFSLPSTMAPDFQKFLPNAQGVPIPLSSSREGSTSVRSSNDDKSGNDTNTSSRGNVDGFSTVKDYSHNGEVNKLKLSPNGSKFLTFDKEGVIHLYDFESSVPIASFKYHKAEGFALEWVDEDSFLSGANDSQIALWDVNKPSTPIQIFKTHSGAINDISYTGTGPRKNGEKKDEDAMETEEENTTGGLFISVSDDYTTQIHEIVSPVSSSSTTSSTPAVIKIENKRIQNAAAFHPDIPTLFLTAGQDNVISLYDLRNTKVPIRKFFGHTESVIGVKWDKNQDPNVFYSWALDKRVIQWDLGSLDEDFTYPEDNSSSSNGSGNGAPGASTGVGKKKSSKTIEDPCMKFIHGGHTNRVNDIDLHPKISGLLTSSGNDSLLEVWRSKTIFEDVEADEDERE